MHDPLWRWWCDARLAAAPVADALPAAIALDVETTGVNRARARMTELALVRIADGSILYSWSSDDRRLPSRAAADVRAVIADRPLVIHNAVFDLGFLVQVSSRWGGSRTPRWICTWRALAGRSLDAIAARVGLSPRARHTAIGDASTLAAVVRHAWNRSPAPHIAVADPAAWPVALRPKALAAPLPSALRSAFRDQVPLRPPSTAQRTELLALRDLVAARVADPSRVQVAVDAATRAGVLRGHLDRLLGPAEPP